MTTMKALERFEIYDTNPEPRPGFVVAVGQLPGCDFPGCDAEAYFDFKTIHGPWANGCREHYLDNREFTTLGVGKGQRLVPRKEDDR